MPTVPPPASRRIHGSSSSPLAKSRGRLDAGGSSGRDTNLAQVSGVSNFGPRYDTKTDPLRAVNLPLTAGSRMLAFGCDFFTSAGCFHSAASAIASHASYCYGRHTSHYWKAFTQVPILSTGDCPEPALAIGSARTDPHARLLFAGEVRLELPLQPFLDRQLPEQFAPVVIFLR